MSPPTDLPVVESAWIDVRTESQAGTRVTLKPGQPMLIGRYPESPVDCRSDRSVSRRHCQIDFSPPHCWVTNLSNNGTRVNGLEVTEFRLDSGDEINIGNSIRFAVQLPNSQQSDESSLASDATRSMQTLGSGPSMLPGEMFSSSIRSEMFAPRKASSGAEMLPLIRSVGQVMDVLQTAMSSEDFYHRAAQAVIDLVGLDTGRILFLRDGQWKLQVLQCGHDCEQSATLDVSTSILEMVRTHRQVFWENGGEQSARASLAMIDAVVAAPIMNCTGEVIGAVYGDRKLGLDATAEGITEWEAMLIELLACSVASGMQRLTQQEQVASLQNQFEQFFTKELAGQLESDPTLLDGRDAVVTTLFCDVRSFSAISEVLGTQRTFEWINDVMDVLSECVVEFEGVLVDYIGDELMAMWGAPVEQPDHAQRACLAAMQMFERLPEVDKRWEPIVGRPTRVGIGINTGPVRVGNTGSSIKFKYGPLGHSVNLASRVQGATKYLMCPMLITGETRKYIGDDFTGRRLCDIQVVNIEAPTPIYELRQTSPDSDSGLMRPYEQALRHFEYGNFRKAIGILANILNDWPEDGPTLLLLSRSVEAITSAEEFSPVWELPGK